MSTIILHIVVVLIWTGFVVLNLWLWGSTPQDGVTERQKINEDSVP